MTTSRGSTPAAPPARTAGAAPDPADIGTIAVEPALAHAPLRRRPAQQRSLVRVQRMLDACAELLDESGYADLSTTRIAERAGVAIGSVYQFFPDKRAITQALGLRYLEMFSVRVGERLEESGFTHWSQAVDVIIDEYLDMHRSVPGFRSLHFGDVVDAHLLDSAADNNGVIAERLRGLLTSLAGAEDGEDLESTVTVAVEAADAVLKLAFRRDPEGDPALIEEMKRMLRAYLGRHVA